MQDAFWFVDYNLMIKQGFSAALRVYYGHAGGGVPTFEDARRVTQAADLLAYPEQFPDCPRVKRLKRQFIQEVAQTAMRTRRAAGLEVPGVCCSF
jgi:hypothetical protein